MAGFVDVFSGSPVQPSDIAYRSIDLDANTILTWPSSLVNTENVVARIMNVTPTANGFSITLPSALEVSVGADFLIYNVGAFSFDLLDNTGGNILNIAPGEAWYVWLTDNTTVAGQWSQVQFGAGTSNAVASALAGNGLTPLAGRLNTNYPYLEVTADYAVTISNRAVFIVWKGGTGTITLPSVLTATRGYYIAVNNQGSGLLTIATPDGSTIDSQPTFSMNPGNSSFFICTLPNWNSLGFGRNNIVPITALPPLNVAAGGPTTVLTTAQYQNTVLQFVGALTSNKIIEFPSIVSYWYVFNNTTNAFTVTAQLSNLNSVILPRGLQVLLYCDGTDLYVISGTSTGNTVSSITGTANQITANPSVGDVTLSLPDDVHINNSLEISNLLIQGTLIQASDLNGGISFYPDGTGTLAIKNSTNPDPAVLRLFANNGTNYAELTAAARTVNTRWNLPLTDSTGSQALVSNGAGILSWADFGTVQTINGTANQITVATLGSTSTISLPAAVIVTTSLTSPTLNAGNLSATGNILSSTNTNGDITLTPNGTGKVVLKGLTYPSADGTVGQVISTDGAGNLSFSNASVTAFTVNVSQAAHGFAVGDVIYLNGTTYAKAIATSVTAAEVIGIVSSVIDVNKFIYQFGGRVTGLAGLTVGSVYFLSDTTAGLATLVEPITAGYVSKPIFISDTVTSAILISESRGSVNTSVSAGSEVAAWCTFQGTGVVNILDSFNVTSVTDNGTGDYTVNYTIPFLNSNYAVNTGAQSTTSGNRDGYMYVNNGGATTGSVRVISGILNAYYAIDNPIVYVSSIYKF